MSTDTQLISSISAEKLVVKNIFCDDFLFEIPNYQRHYSWEEEHCTQLLDDLHSFAFKDQGFDELPPYFLGSAVVIKKENERAAQIVDGQQRLTTLTILLSCLRHSIQDAKSKDTISNLIFQKGNELLGTSETFRLKTRKRDQEFFKKLIQDPDGLAKHFEDPEKTIFKNDAQWQMMSNAMALVKSFERKEYSQEQLRHIAKYIIQKCVIVVVASTDQDMAFRIFNVLNDRGKDLTIADILKSEIIEKISEEQQNSYTDKWEECEAQLGTDNFKDFFSYLRSIFAKKKAEKSILNEIRDYINPSKKPEQFIDTVLVPFAAAYFNIIKENYQSSNHAEDVNNQFKRLKRVSHTDWIPSAIYFMAKHPNEPKKVKDFLVQLEKVTLGMEAGRFTLNERIERFAKINLQIEAGESLYETESSLLLSNEDREYIISSLLGPDLYGKRLVKPVLARIEEEMNDGSISVNFDSLNIEHILPQTPDDYWKGLFRSEVRNKWTNNLGNLSLITVRKNSQAKNYPFENKINIYFKADGRASNLAMVNSLLDYSEWNMDNIQDRNITLLNHFLRAVNLAPYIEPSKN